MKPGDSSASTVTLNSTPTLKSSPDLNLAKILAPSRFQTSGGTVPLSLNVALRSGSTCGQIASSPGSKFSASVSVKVLVDVVWSACDGSGCVVLARISSALAFVSRKTLASNAISSRSYRFGEPKPPVLPFAAVTRDQSEVPASDKLEYLATKHCVGVDKPRQRPAQKTLPEAGEWPGTDCP